MSYCRWSTDNFACDLYAYAEAAGVFTIHVAAQRYVGDIPKLPDWNENPTVYLAAINKQHAFLLDAKQERIGLPHDGETFNEETLQDFLDRMIYLRRVGYRFPDYVIDEIKEEIDESKKISPVIRMECHQ